MSAYGSAYTKHHGGTPPKPGNPTNAHPFSGIAAALYPESILDLLRKHRNGRPDIARAIDIFKGVWYARKYHWIIPKNTHPLFLQTLCVSVDSLFRVRFNAKRGVCLSKIPAESLDTVEAMLSGWIPAWKYVSRDVFVPRFTFRKVKVEYMLHCIDDTGTCCYTIPELAVLLRDNTLHATLKFLLSQGVWKLEVV